MSTVVSKAGELRLLRNAVNGPLMVRLFMNDVRPKRTDGVKAFREPKYRGYEPLPLKSNRWVEDEAAGLLVHPMVQFRFLGPLGRVYGYFITQDDTVLWVERFDDSEPFFARVVGDQLRIIPSLGWRQS